MADVEREPWVQIKRNNDGSRRFYWTRHGFASATLPADWNAAMIEARRLNTKADRGLLKPKAEADGGPENTLCWYCDRFEKSEHFKTRAVQTQRNYRVALNDARARWPTAKIAKFRKRDIKRALESIESLGSRRVARNVLRQVFEMALDDELIDRNPVDYITLPEVRPRRQLWPDEAIDKFLGACRILDEEAIHPSGPGGLANRWTGYIGRAEAMRRAFILLEYTGQRPVDVLNMRWSHDDGEFIRVRQQKTGKLVDIYRGELGPMLGGWKDALPVKPLTDDAPYATIVHGPDGRQYTMKWFDMAFRRVATAAGIDPALQARDLRRTAVTRLYEAGCSEGIISAVTGHEIETCRQILENYYVRTREASKAGITALDEYRARRRKRAAAEE